MAERYVTFFHMRLPILGDAPIIKFPDGDYRFWEVRNKHGERCLVFREMVGVVSIQERVDYWLRKESSHFGLNMIFADHIVPCDKDSVAWWARTHQKQIEGFDLEANLG